MRLRVRVLQLIGSAVFAQTLTGSLAAVASEFPAKSIRYVVPLPPGGPADTVARLIASRLAERLGQPVVVDNRTGASTIIGTEIVARAPADGYTMLMMTTTHTINPSVIRKLPYDLLTDFVPVTLTASAPFILVVHPQVPAKNLKELVSLAQAKPGALNYGTSGVGSSMHLTGALFENTAQVSMTHVPYKGAGPAFVELLGGQIQVVFSSALASIPHMASGKLRGIAVTSLKRIASAPTLPTVAESGYPSFESSSWNGVIAPARTPGHITSRLHTEIVAVLAMPAIREALVREGAEVGGNSPAAFGAYIKSEIEKWSGVVRRIGIKPE